MSHYLIRPGGVSIPFPRPPGASWGICNRRLPRWVSSMRPPRQSRSCGEWGPVLRALAASSGNRIVGDSCGLGQFLLSVYWSLFHRIL